LKKISLKLLFPLLLQLVVENSKKSNKTSIFLGSLLRKFINILEKSN
jgi:hypothetical protein